eukprot:574194-Rhodomonas_salina.2
MIAHKGATRAPSHAFKLRLHACHGHPEIQHKKPALFQYNVDQECVPPPSGLGPPQPEREPASGWARSDRDTTDST